MSGRITIAVAAAGVAAAVAAGVAGPEAPEPAARTRPASVLKPVGPGWVKLFNGQDLTGWKGLVGDPRRRARMTPEQLARAQAKADENMRAHWSVADGALVFDGRGRNLCTAKDYSDFELLVDWKVTPGGDSGIYLRGTPQVQIWCSKQGSGGLYTNQKHPRRPLLAADRPPGQWNTFYIRMVGEMVTVYLNGQLVVDHVAMENYWERSKPIYSTGPIELQSHGSKLYFRNLYVREIPRAATTASGPAGG